MVGGTRSPKVPRWDEGKPSDPVYPWDRLRPIPIEAMNSIQMLHLAAQQCISGRQYGRAQDVPWMWLLGGAVAIILLPPTALSVAWLTYKFPPAVPPATSPAGPGPIVPGPRERQ